MDTSLACKLATTLTRDAKEYHFPIRILVG